MIIHLPDGTCKAIDYREKAPLAAHERMYLDEDGELIRDLNHEGYLAVGVPGSVAGLIMALENFGRLDLPAVIAPAIRLADKGFPLSYALARDFEALAPVFRDHPGSRKSFLRPDGSAYQMGDVWTQKDLAATLKRIAKQGREGFYGGETARIFESEMHANGGLITREDLAAYRAVMRDPVQFAYRGYTVYSMSPPSSGGITLAIMLNVLSGYDLESMGHNSAAYIHFLAEAMRRAYAARAAHLGDPDFNPDMPVARLLSREYADSLRRSINPQTASHSDPGSFVWGGESEETTHYSVVDRDGMMVSTTTTLEYGYGSRIVLNGAGFLLNNEMGDFNPWPGRTDSSGLIGTEANLIRPGKRMLSSMTPTILAQDGQAVMAVGSPGGRTIINTVLQCILNVVDFDMNIFDAVDAPRFHHQWLPDRLSLEERATTRDSQQRLEEMGHRVTWRGTQGRAMGIYIDRRNGLRTGAADPRSPDGAAAGY